MAAASGLTTRRFLPVLTALVLGVTSSLPSPGAAAPLDPYAQAVVDSVAHPPPSTPRQLLAAALMTADVEAADAAVAYAKRLADVLTDAGEARGEMLASLGDEADPGSLLRLRTLLAAHEPDLVPLVEAIDAAARERRRDPKRLATAAADLRSPSSATRLAATSTLGRAGLAALPILAEVLASTDDAGTRARGIARGLVRDLGPEGTQALLAQLGSAEVRSWPGVIAALDAMDTDDVAEFLLAPATVPDTPPEIRDRALHALQRIHVRCAGPTSPWQPPRRGEAIAGITRRLDHVLTPGAVHAARADDPANTLRLRDGLHLARDLTALGATKPEAVRLVLLARLAALVEAPGAPPVPALDSPQLAQVLAGPDGLDLEAIADTLDLACARGWFTAAAAAARGIEEATLPPDQPLDAPTAPLPVSVRRALVRALAIPDAELQFTAARTLALLAPAPPWPGSSRVVETLAHASTAEGGDRVVVAHHDAEAAHEIATGLSRFGYRTLTVSTGRAAVLAAREHADTVLVVLGARIILPSAYETTQFIQEQPFGDVPPVLIVVDPLDDAPRGRFLTNSILKFSSLGCVAIVDRLESFFQPTRDAATGRELAPARFPAALEALAGPDAASVEARAARSIRRRERALQASALLQILDRRGWDVPLASRAAFPLEPASDPAGYNRPSFTPLPSAPVDAARSEPTR